MISQDRLIQEFMELVRIDSETRNERQIADVLKEKFSALGLTAIEDDSQERTGHGAGNLFVTWPADNGAAAPKLLFTCHMDTVVPGQNIKPTLGEDGWITSDGSTILGADDKAGLAALFEAIRVIQEQGVAHGQIQFVITASMKNPGCLVPGPWTPNCWMLTWALRWIPTARLERLRLLRLPRLK